MYTKDGTYYSMESKDIGDWVSRNKMKGFYAGKPEYIKRVERNATAVIMVRQLKKGIGK